MCILHCCPFRFEFIRKVSALATATATAKVTATATATATLPSSAGEGAPLLRHHKAGNITSYKAS